MAVGVHSGGLEIHKEEQMIHDSRFNQMDKLGTVAVVLVGDKDKCASPDASTLH